MSAADARTIAALVDAAAVARLFGRRRHAMRLLRRAWILTLEAVAPGPVVQ